MFHLLHHEALNSLVRYIVNLHCHFFGIDYFGVTLMNRGMSATSK